MGKIKNQIKTKATQAANKAKEKAEWAKKELIDRKLLDLTTNPLDPVKKKIAEGKSKIHQEKDMALQLGARVLAKAQDIRQSLTKEELLKISKEQQVIFKKRVAQQAFVAKEKTRKRIKSLSVRKKSPSSDSSESTL